MENDRYIKENKENNETTASFNLNQPRKSVLKSLDPFYHNSPESNPLPKSSRYSNVSNLDNSISLIKLECTSESNTSFKIEDTPVSKNVSNYKQYENIDINDISTFMKEEEPNTNEVNIDDLLSIDNFSSKIISTDTLNQIRKYHKTKIVEYVLKESKLSNQIVELNNQNTIIIQQSNEQFVELTEQINKLKLENSNLVTKLNEIQLEYNSCQELYDKKYQNNFVELENQIEQLNNNLKIIKNESNHRIELLQNENDDLKQQNISLSSNSCILYSLLDQHYDTIYELTENFESLKTQNNNTLSFLKDQMAKVDKSKEIVNKQQEHNMTLLKNKEELELEIKEIRHSVAMGNEHYEHTIDELKERLDIFRKQVELLLRSEEKVENERLVKNNLLGEIKRVLQMK